MAPKRWPTSFVNARPSNLLTWMVCCFVLFCFLDFSFEKRQRYWQRRRQRAGRRAQDKHVDCESSIVRQPNRRLRRQSVGRRAQDEQLGDELEFEQWVARAICATVISFVCFFLANRIGDDGVQSLADALTHSNTVIIEMNLDRKKELCASVWRRHTH